MKCGVTFPHAYLLEQYKEYKVSGSPILILSLNKHTDTITGRHMSD